MDEKDLIEIANKVILLLNPEKETCIKFTQKEIQNLIDTTSKILQKEPTVLHLEGKFVIVGDIHGNIKSLIYILKKYGFPPQTSYLFLGDYIDRGSCSCEVLILLYSLKALFPNNLFMLRGNHEFLSMCAEYGFASECAVKLNEQLFNSFIQSFQYIPLCAIIGKTFCVHGGISNKINSLEDISKISKVQIEKIDGVETDLLWSDPSQDVDGFEPNARGVGCVFGSDALDHFLDCCGFIRVIRAHEFCETGCKAMFGNDQKVITVFSSYDYCGKYNNAGIVRIDENENIEMDSFSPLDVKESSRVRTCLIGYGSIFPKVNPIDKNEILNVKKDFKPDLIEI